jgi:hypothetical protein
MSDKKDHEHEKFMREVVDDLSYKNPEEKTKQDQLIQTVLEGLEERFNRDMTLELTALISIMLHSLLGMPLGAAIKSMTLMWETYTLAHAHVEGFHEYGPMPERAESPSDDTPFGMPPTGMYL